MSFMDKIKDATKQAKDSATKFAEDKGLSEKFDNATASIKASIEETKANVAAHKEASKEAKKPLDGCIQWYEVIYKGGLIKYGTNVKTSGSIGLNILPDSFYFKPLITAQDWFEDLEIPYDTIKKFEIVKRTVSNTEVLLSNSSADAAALATNNTLAITYMDGDTEVYLKMEMLTGITVQGQATKCEELLDVLRTNKIYSRINKPESSGKSEQLSTADELKKFKELFDNGIISQEEFDAKKKQLLGL